MRIKGLTSSEQALVERLLKLLKTKHDRNKLRSSYMDGKHMLDNLPPTAPPYLSQLKTVLGWPAKAVEHLARRIRLENFTTPNSDLSAFGLDQILQDNDYYATVAQAQISSLVHSTVFQTVTTGGEGEPEVLIHQVSALEGTGEWDYRLRRLKNFISVQSWGVPTAGQLDLTRSGAFTLFTDYQVVTVIDGQVVERATDQIVRLPVTHLPYKPRIDRPVGSSRISRAVMALTDTAVRTLLRSEGTADLYGVPWFVIFGPDESAFSKSSWQMVTNRINAIPDVVDVDGTRQRADVKQFSQGAQTPHVDQLQVIAGLFAGETNIPVSSLGVGLTQANPTSAESYIASREDLIAEAEDAQTFWSTPHVNTMQWAWMIANQTSELPQELQKLAPIWRDARHTSRASAADATVKLVSALPWLAESETMLETLGFDHSVTARLKTEQRRARSGALMLDLIGEKHGQQTRDRSTTQS